MRASERGATAILVALVLAVLLGFVALSLDIGHLVSVRGELQNGADAAALAGAKRLSGRNRHFELPGALADARSFARNHPTDRYDVEPTTIQLGAWLPKAVGCGTVRGTEVQLLEELRPDPTHHFCAIPGTTEADAANISAVRVVTRRVGTPGGTGGGSVELAFGSFVGQSGPKEVAAEAIALSGGPMAEACPEFPLAIRAGCLYEGGELRCDASGVGALYYVGLNPAPVDSAGLTSLSTDPANGKVACEILNRDSCSPIDGGVPIEIQNGGDWKAACDSGCAWKGGAWNPGKNDSLCEVIRRKADQNCDGNVDDENQDGVPDTLGRIPVVQYAGESADTCSGQYNHEANIVGWATMGIVSVRCEGFNQLPPNTAPITKLCDDYQIANGDFSGSTCVAIRMFCDQEDDEPTRAGGGWYGTSPYQPVLVR